jgi:hypothetical protein
LTGILPSKGAKKQGSQKSEVRSRKKSEFQTKPALPLVLF